MADRRNAEGYKDPTAYEATRKLEEKEHEKELVIGRMMEHIKYIAGINGFEICNRITFKDKETGRRYR